MSTPEPGSIAIVIVSYNTCDHLRHCLQSIPESIPESTTASPTGPTYALRVVVVDNASHDGSPEMVAAEFPNVHLVASQHNLGFTGGNNLALYLLGFDNVAPPSLHPDLPARWPKPDYVFLLNPDAELTPGALQALTGFMATHPDAAICGPQLRYGDGTFQHGAFAFPDWRQVALDLMPIPVLPGVRRLWTRLLHSHFNGRYPAQAWQGDRPFAVDFVLGAAMFVRSTAIDAVGGLDDAFFMYCEEMDWCLRMATRGLGIYAVPDAVVIHHEAQSSRQVHRAAYVRLWRSRLRFFAKHADRYAPLHRAAIHAMARLHWRSGKQRALRALAAGYLTDAEAQAELDIYAELLRL